MARPLAALAMIIAAAAAAKAIVVVPSLQREKRKPGRSLQPPKNLKSARQQTRRAQAAQEKLNQDLVLYQGKTFAARSSLHQKLDGILVLREQDKANMAAPVSGKQSVPGRGHHNMPTFGTTIRMALCPGHVSGSAFAQAAFSSAVGKTLVGKARIRAACAVVTCVQDFVLQDTVRGLDNSLALHRMIHNAWDPSTIPGCLECHAPFLFLLASRWDGTPHPVFVVKHQHFGGGLSQATSSKGADCFSQKLNFAFTGPASASGAFNLMPMLSRSLPIPPKALINKTTKTLLSTVEFQCILDRLVHYAGMLKLSQGLPPLVFMASTTSDEAAENVRFVRFLQAYFSNTFLHYLYQPAAAALLRDGDPAGGPQDGPAPAPAPPQDPPLPPPFIVIINHALCLAHQLSLCSRSQYCFCGGDGTVSSGKRFIQGLAGLSHVFNNSSYFFRIWSAANHAMANVKVLLPVDAAAQGIAEVSPEIKQHRYHLLLFLTRAVFQKYELPDDIMWALKRITLLLNGSWSRGVGLVHIHNPVGCPCGGVATFRQDLLGCARALLFRRPTTPSETRWTSMLPAFAFVALWEALNGMATQSLSAAFQDPAAATPDAGATEDTSDDFHAIFGRRLRRAFASLRGLPGSPDTALASLCATLSNAPLHRMFVIVLKHDPTTRHKDTRDHVTRLIGAIGDSGSDSDDDDQAPGRSCQQPRPRRPIATVLARGTAIRKCLADGAALLSPAGLAGLPKHIEAFRSLYTPGEITDHATTIALLWRSLLPGGL